MSIRTGDEAQALMGELLAWAADCPPREGLAALQGWRGQIEVCRAQIVERQRAEGATDAQIDRLMGLGQTSRADRKRAKDRAETIGRNGDLARDVNSGALTIEQLDAVAAADAKTGGAAANDKDLLADVAAANPDTARRAADQWLAARATNADLEERRRQQRRRREARKGTTTDGLASLQIAGDDESVAQMWAAIVDTADRMYREDGGRDLQPGEHPRTADQRLFDAAHQHITSPGTGRGGGGVAAGTTIIVTADKLNQLARQARTAGPSSDRCASPGDPPSVDCGTSGGHSHCGDAVDPSVPAPASAPAPAEMIGVGPIPDTLLEQLACNADFVATLFDGPGQVLWHGRDRRYPTKAQMVALIARDRGCVLCGAHPQRCEAHHLLPWSAPGKGRTDIDDLALVCQRHHREIHEQVLTLFWEALTGRWRTRPARPHEIPRPRPVEGRTRKSPRSGSTGGDHGDRVEQNDATRLSVATSP